MSCVMVFWVSNDGFGVDQFDINTFDMLIEDVTGFQLDKTANNLIIKYIAKRFLDTPYHDMFNLKYSIKECQYKSFVDIFNRHANNGNYLEVLNETQKVC